jgi:hypothetical protein
MSGRHQLLNGTEVLRSVSHWRTQSPDAGGGYKGTLAQRHPGDGRN